ncbi:dnaJ homolog subfamily C member 7 isoform X1 [Pieris napi]|uniref:dnaJ homolog subfamily C member 7 isoform X1 n=1 Tax=Pieris napi TaxID=78633 RepID=UPI001FBA11CE|nr:dnaJ homolog subfamily C member 7 isoform X1 [Pieris napi]
MAASEVADLDLTIDDLVPKTPEKLAEEKKESGNHLYKFKNYKGALAMYEESIKLCPENAAYYGNRSACYMMLGMYKKAVEDAQKAVALDSTFTKGYIRMAKCCIALGDLSGAEQAITRATELGGADCALNEKRALESLRRLHEDAQNAMEANDHRRVVFCMDRCLEYSPSSSRAKLIKAECLAMLGRCQEAQEIANDSLRFDSFDTEAIYVRGLCLYFEDKDEQAFKHFQQVLRLAPDHRKAIETYKKAKLLKQKKEEGNEAFKMGQWQQALHLYNEALTIDKNNRKVNAKLYFNKATVCAKLNQTREAADACTAALELDENYVKALLRRAKCYTELGEFEEAVKDYERLYKIDKTKENKQLLHEAKIALKKSKRKDYYKILGIEKTASDDDIKKAYRKRALVHHPDRHANASDNERREQEKRFKDVGEAYGVLSDPKKRARYDHGQDLDDDGSGVGDLDPNVVYQTFFRGGVDPQFNFSHGGFPGHGFSFQFG